MMGGVKESMGNARKRQFFNRELSWLQFNRRVQVEADNPSNPLLERTKFLAIVSGNLDEFIQVRLHGVIESAALRRTDDPCGLAATTIMERVMKGVLHQENMQYMLYEGLQSELYLGRVRLYPTFALNQEQQEQSKRIFDNEIRPLCRPEPLGAKGAMEALPQKQLHLCLAVTDSHGSRHELYTMPLPTALPRLYELNGGDGQCLITLEDLIKLFLSELFPGRVVSYACVYRILRNQNFPTRNEEAGVEESVRDMLIKRRTGEVMRLEVEARMPEAMQNRLRERLNCKDERIYRVTGPVDLNKLFMRLYGMLDKPELKYPVEPELETPELMGDDIFGKIASRDYFLMHPYISFDPVVHFIESAADDANVLSIKQTLYRVSHDSPIVHALERAAQSGKRVWVMFEARARFDEENNLFWGERLERAGCFVSYGIPRYKTHSKITLVTRREQDQVKSYLHLGTGNYHDGTAHIYTDMGILTADAQLCRDAEAFFHQIEGFSDAPELSELIKAPDMLLDKLLSLIDREKKHALAGRRSGIVAKMNGLVDWEIISALYDASTAGVPIQLIVRGICCLVPGVRGMSENIRVISIVGRHLEHARAFRFENGGDAETYLSSADWMPRNLRKRVELMFPIKNAAIASEIGNVLSLQLCDNEKAWQLAADGLYARVQAGTRMPVNAQEELLHNARAVFTGKINMGEISDFSMI